jgi:Zn-dependent peptidase ImmA (M78 family)
MTTAKAVGAVSREAAEWYAIDWQAIHRNVRRLQVRIVQATKASRFYGMVHRNSDGTAVIGVNSMDAPNRQRFTIAHEIGHLLLHKDEHLHVDEKSPIGLRNDRSSLAIDEREIEANQFAAELLMPVELLEKDLGRLPDDIETEEAVTRLARLYQVSEQAMTVRLTALKVLS